MARLGQLNMIIGFAVLFFAASAGSFIAFDITEGFLKDKAILDSWKLLLMRSAHGHTNLFALVHIAFGLTLPYSSLSSKIKALQTVGLGLGTLAMSILMMLRAWQGPTEEIDVIAIVTGGFLSASLCAIASHCYGLLYKWKR